MSDPISQEPPEGFGTDALNKRMAAQRAGRSFAPATGSVTLDYQTAHDAELMLWNYLYCMDRGIIPPKGGWVRQAVAETRKKLADVTKAASPNNKLSGG